ncbi:hypothetical protein FRUB_08869 [Fimbriiglobus ruber]|uniref:Uncharacterized protein n=1 Tax=Fimbriiglobus ruber TaxID=1908690 RepID=A0A225DG26_9BACT|nr:hypothetical protein FRUB_08869 [Fimbriiglobus ruber]
MAIADADHRDGPNTVSRSTTPRGGRSHVALGRRAGVETARARNVRGSDPAGHLGASLIGGGRHRSSECDGQDGEQ